MHARLDQGGPFRESIPRSPGIHVTAQVVQKCALLGQNQGTLDPLGCLGQQLDRFLLPVEKLEQSSDHLNRGAVPGLRCQRLAAGGERVFVAILELVKVGPLDREPRAIG